MRRHLSSAAGSSIVEVTVAAALLLIGVLGTAQLVDAASRKVADTEGRSQAAGIAREVAEAARSVPAQSLTATAAVGVLRSAAPALEPLPGTVWTVERGGTRYDITATGCTLDDATDGIAAASARDASFCPAGATTSPADQQPADAQRLHVAVSWRSGNRPRRLTQAVLLPLSGVGSVSEVTGLRMTNPFVCTLNCTISTNASSASFGVTASGAPSSMRWSVDGAPMGSCPPASATCSGSGTSWSFTWNLGVPTRDTTNGSPNQGMCIAGNYVRDGLYQVGAQVEDSAGAAAPLTMPVRINRCAPLIVPMANATRRNASTWVIDTEWESSTEGDVVGYRVYKGTSVSTRSVVCPPSISQGQVIALEAELECTDPNPPAYSSSPYYYAVIAVDVDPSGNLREGAYYYMNVNTSNRAPNAPLNYAGSRASGAPRLTWSLPSTQDPDSGDTIARFRVYRAAGTVTGNPPLSARYDYETKEAVCSGSTCAWTDPDPPSSTATYWITAVDTNLRESSFVGPRSL